MQILFALVFFVYNYVMQSYVSSVIGTTRSNKFIIVITYVLNLILFIFGAYIPSIQYSIFLIPTYLLLLYFEFRVFHKRDSYASLFTALSFALNFVSIRFVVSSTLLLITNSYNYELVALISIILSMCFISVVKYKIPQKYLDIIITDLKSIAFSCVVNGTIYLYLFVVTIVFNYNATYTASLVLSILVGACAIFGYIITTYYSYNFSKLKFDYYRFNELTVSIKNEEDKISKLKADASTDALTELSTRDVAEDKIKYYIENKKEFFLVLLDIDYLKEANDNYGHEEGDFYIKKTSEMISNVFDEAVVSRIGGDEFLVIAEATSSYDVMTKTVLCADSVSNLASLYKKQYKTSLSYGVLNVSKNETRTIKELINLVDEKMYEYKKRNKKERSTIIPR